MYMYAIGGFLGALIDGQSCKLWLADNPDQPTVEHFQMLRRQWASKAQLLMATLDELPDADLPAVQSELNY